jgi:hypothetical protein
VCASIECRVSAAPLVLLDACRVRLIDFTASRLQTPGGDVVFCDLEAEDGIFDGPKGQPQFETYRCAPTQTASLGRLTRLYFRR